MVVGSSGVGFACLDLSSIFSDVTSIICSTATYTGTTIATALGNPDLSYATYTRCPWSTTGVASTKLQYKIVGAGLKLTYTGKLLDRNGIYICSQPPEGTGINGMNYSSLMGFGNSTKLPVGSKPVQTVYIPNDSNEFSVPVAGPYTADLLRPLVILVVANPETSFSVDVVVHLEVVSTSFQNTRTDSDPIGMGAIHNSLPNTVPSDGQSDYISFMRRMSQYLSATTSAISQAAPYIGVASRYYSSRQNPQLEF